MNRCGPKLQHKENVVWGLWFSLECWATLGDFQLLSSDGQMLHWSPRKPRSWRVTSLNWETTVLQLHEVLPCWASPPFHIVFSRCRCSFQRGGGQDVDHWSQLAHEWSPEGTSTAADRPVSWCSITTGTLRSGRTSPVFSWLCRSTKYRIIQTISHSF